MHRQHETLVIAWPKSSCMLLSLTVGVRLPIELPPIDCSKGEVGRDAREIAEVGIDAVGLLEIEAERGLEIGVGVQVEIGRRVERAQIAERQLVAAGERRSLTAARRQRHADAARHPVLLTGVFLVSRTCSRPIVAHRLEIRAEREAHAEIDGIAAGRHAGTTLLLLDEPDTA